MISNDIKVFNAKDLKLEKEIAIEGEYINAHNLSENILLVKKNGYVLVDKNSFNLKEFPAEIVDSVDSENSAYLILKDRYKKIK